MDTSIFTQQFQSVMYQFVFQMMEDLQTSLQADASPTAPAEDTSKASVGYSSASTPLAVNGSFADLIKQASEKYNVNPNLVSAVIKAESNYNPQAVSPAGAMGMMQLMPGTARSLGVSNPFDPTQNVEGGVHLLRQLLDRYSNNVQLALAAYNAGPGAVDRYHGIPPYAETQTYVSRVMGYYQSGFSWEG